VNPTFAIVPAILVYLVQELVIKKWRTTEKAAVIDKPQNRNMDKVFYVLVWILVAIFFLGMFLVWAGVIYNQIIREYSNYTTTLR
jgi:hypothetical protein